MRTWSMSVASALIALSLASTGIAATTQRTFVASSGNDANSCSIASPCRSFGAAIAQANAGGEVLVLDTAGYGPVTITKSIAIIAPPGVYAGITVASGDSGVLIQAGATDVVTLRGLTVNGLGVGEDGIRIESAGVVHVERCVVDSLANDGIIMIAGTQMELHVVDTLLRHNANAGLDAFGTGFPGDQSTVEITRSSIVDTGSVGAFLVDVTRSSIVETVISGNAIGLSVGTLESAANIAVSIDRSEIALNGVGLEVGGSTDTVTSVVHVSNSVISNNNSVALEIKDKGVVRLMSTQLTGNNIAVQLTGTGAIASLQNNMRIGNQTAGPAANPITAY